MTKTFLLFVLTTGLILASAPNAVAQATSTGAFLNVNVGAQIKDRTIATSNTFRIYEETASISATQEIGKGLLFDVSGGGRVRRWLALGVGISQFSKTEEATVTATIPHPFFFNRARTATSAVDNLKRSELGIHLQAILPIPLTDNIEVSVFAGPSFIRVEQDIVTGASVQAGTQNSTPVTESESKMVTGANGGVDVTYRVTNRVGVGVFFRYAGGSVDFPAVQNLKVGGGQAGTGLRLRF